MCYSFKTSLISYLIGMISGIVSLFIEEYIVGLLILAYCQIQLAEAIIWKGIDTDNVQLNKIGTIYAKYTLPSHLLAVGIGIMITLIYTQNKDNKIENNIEKKNIIIPVIIGLLFYIGVVIFYSFPNSIKQNMKDAEEGLSYPSNLSCMKRECQNNENRLQWPFKDEWYILQTIIIFGLFIYYNVYYTSYIPYQKSLILALFFGITYIISRLTYYWSSSSIWCFLSAILSPLLVLSLFLYKKYKNYF
jgi:hypothetical protein